MKLTVVCDHKLTKKDNDFYINTGPYERAINRYLSVFDNIEFISRSVIDGDIKGKILINHKNVKVISNSCLAFNLGFIFNCKKMIKDIREVLENSDACIIHLPSIMGLAAIGICRKLGKPYLIEVVGSVWDVYWNHSIEGKIIAPILTVLTKYEIKNANYVLYVTEIFLQDKFPTYGKNIACSDVLFPSISEDIIIKRSEKINNITSDKPIVIGTTAVMNVLYKGQEHIIKAIAKLNREGSNFEYHLVGGGDNSYLKSVVERYNVADKVKFLGYLPHEKVFDYLDSIDIYAQPSKTEGLPRALIEAMSRGCPCIGSSVGGIPELTNSEFVFQYADVNQICYLLKKIDKEVMITEATRSFNKAREFDKDLLDKKRNAFFKMFSKGG